MTTTEVTEDQVLNPFQTESAWELIGEQIPEPDWLIEGFLPKPYDGGGMKVMVGGPPKSLKSTLAKELAFSLATGLPFLGHLSLPGKQGNVLYIDEENTRANDRKTLTRIIDARLGTDLAREYEFLEHELLAWEAKQFLELEPDRLEMIRAERIRLADHDARQRIIKTIESLEAKWLFLDSLYRFTPGLDLDKGSGASQVVDWVEEIRVNTGVNVVILHHAGKTRGTAGTAGDRLMHSTYFRAWYETLIFSASRGDKVIETLTEHREMPPQDEALGLRMTSPGNWNYNVPLHSQTREKEDRAERVKDFVSQHREEFERAAAESKAAAARLLKEKLWWYEEHESTAKRDLEEAGLW